MPHVSAPEPDHGPRPDQEETVWYGENGIGLTGTIQALTEGRIKVRKRTFVTGFCHPNTPLPGAEFKPRVRTACSGCGKRRLTTATTSGPKCNDCLVAR